MTESVAERWPIETIIADVKAIYQGEFDLRTSWDEEEAGLRDALPRLRDKLDHRYTYAHVLGVGGSGVVLRLKDDAFRDQDVALKFPRPVVGRAQLLREMLTKEITFLAELKHPGIVQILYHGHCFVPNYPDGMPFYLMEAVDGVRSDKYLRGLVTDAQNKRHDAPISVFETRVLALMREVLAAIRYLHEHPSGARVHLDIKPENIIVRSNGQPVVIDLGTCKRIRFEKDQTVVACTLSMAAPSLVRRLRTDPTDKNRAGGAMSREEIQPRWDLWAFAASMFGWLGIDPSNGRNKRDAACELLPPYSRKYLILLAARLMANEAIDDIPSWFTARIGLSQSTLRDMAVYTAAAALELLDRLIGTSNPLERVPEMAVRALTTLQSADGIHLPLTKPLIAVLEHRAIRRLESIAQLGVVVEVYPEARQTRKEHSLGTYGWTIQYLKALYSDPVSPLFKQWITDDDCRDVLLAALLHDIGHFPLAHDLEDVDPDLFNHSDLTNAWLSDSYRKLGVDKQHIDSLKQVIQGFGSSSERVLAILTARANLTSAAIAPKAKFLRSIISGPIDADKIDYLLRDGERMRLPYPRGIDVERVLRSLTTVVVEKIEGGARDVPLIAVHSKGKVAAEFISIARYAMFCQGYWHHTVRSMKAMLARAVRALTARASTSARSDLQRRFNEFAFSLPESLFPGTGAEQGLMIMTKPRPAIAALAEVPQLAASDVAVLRWLEGELALQNRPERVLIGAILSRRLYKRLWVVSRDMQEKQWDSIAKKWSALKRDQKHLVSLAVERRIATKLRKAKTSVTGLSIKGVRELIEVRKKQNAPWLLVDIPEAKPGSVYGLYYVLEGQRRQLRKDDKVVGVTEKSEVWTEYAQGLLEKAGKIRIFCDPDFVDFIEANVTSEVGIETVTEALIAVAAGEDENTSEDDIEEENTPEYDDEKPSAGNA